MPAPLSSPACPRPSGRQRCLPPAAAPRRCSSPGRTSLSGCTRPRRPSSYTTVSPTATASCRGPSRATRRPFPRHRTPTSTASSMSRSTRGGCAVRSRRTRPLWLVSPQRQCLGLGPLLRLLGPLFKRGGYLQSLATWTVDDGDGSNDLLVAFGSEGDVAVYGGTDVDTADAWTLQGVYYAGAPIAGHRFHCKVNGDLKFLTDEGRRQHEQHADLDASLPTPTKHGRHPEDPAVPCGASQSVQGSLKAGM